MGTLVSLSVWITMMGKRLLALALVMIMVVGMSAETSGTLAPFKHLDGTTTSVVGVSEIPIADAKRVLASYDKGMELDMETAGQWGFDGDKFPIMWMLNNMTHLYTTPLDIIPGLCEQYYEFIVLLPFVQLVDNTTVKGGTSLQLYLDNAWAVTGGRLYYGMPKTLAHTDWNQEDQFTAFAELESSLNLVNASMDIQRSASVPYATFAPSMTMWTFAFNGMIIQKSSDPLTSRHFCSTMPMDWTKASFAPASFSLSLGPTALLGLPDGLSADVDAVDPSVSKTLGAFYMANVDWSLSEPMTHCF